MRYFESIANAILDRSPEELIGALLIASVTAGIVAGIYALGCKRSNPGSAFVGALGLGAGTLCMALTAGYFKHKESRNLSPAPTNFAGSPRSPRANRRGGGRSSRAVFVGPGRSSGFHVLDAADENRDGRLTPEEAADLVRKADVDGDGTVNARDIDRLVADRLRSRRQTNRPSAPNKPDPALRIGSANEPNTATHIEE